MDFRQELEHEKGRRARLTERAATTLAPFGELVGSLRSAGFDKAILQLGLPAEVGVETFKGHAVLPPFHPDAKGGDVTRYDITLRAKDDGRLFEIAFSWPSSDDEYHSPDWSESYVVRDGASDLPRLLQRISNAALRETLANETGPALGAIRF